MPGEKRVRRDAAANHERLVDAALRVFAESGIHAPLSTIVTEAGVGTATFYRCFTDRDALMRELEARAYGALIAIIDELELAGVAGLAAVEAFLTRSLDLADRLVLPLHGAPPLVDAESVRLRRRIDGGLEQFLDQARATGDLASMANATDIIMCSALITQPLGHGPDWRRTAERHVALFVGGLTSAHPLPGPPVHQSDLEARWTAMSKDRRCTT